MSETEKVVNILISQPQTDRVWDQAVHAIGAKMGWHSGDTIAFVEHQIRKNAVILRTEPIDRAADPKRKAQSWWERI